MQLLLQNDVITGWMICRPSAAAGCFMCRRWKHGWLKCPAISLTDLIQTCSVPFLLESGWKVLIITRLMCFYQLSLHCFTFLYLLLHFAYVDYLQYWRSIHEWLRKWTDEQSIPLYIRTDIRTCCTYICKLFCKHQLVCSSVIYTYNYRQQLNLCDHTLQPYTL